MKYYEYQLQLQTPTSRIDLSPFKQQLPDDIQYVKLRLNAFSYILQNTGVADGFEVSLSTNVYTPYMLGDAPRNNLYTSSIYVSSGNTEVINNYGSPTQYLIVHKNDLNGDLLLNWTATPLAIYLGAGTPNLQNIYASISLIPIKNMK